jgi:hypothetical protein
MNELESINQGTDWRKKIDVDYDVSSEITTFRIGTTAMSVSEVGTPAAIATVAWGTYGTPTAGHTIGYFTLTKEQTAALAVGSYYWIIKSVGVDTTHPAEGTVQVVL